jgi:hypothetical protein
MSFFDQTDEFEVVTSVENRRIPTGISREELRENYSHVFQEIIDSKAKIVQMVFLAPLCWWALELLYDLGARETDHIHLT